MSIVDRWLLPDGVDEVLPPEAQKLETIRRQLLDIFQSWGYLLVIPPMIEFLESLLTGTGSDLDLKTFKVTDQLSGRMMGIRADITPQVARIDAHSLNQPGDVRLCYAGTALHAKADNMFLSRVPISVGAELFGDTGSSGDLEIVSLMVESINSASKGSAGLHIELGDVGIFRELVQIADISSEEELLFDLIQRKALPELENKVKDLSLSAEVARLIVSLPGLCGNAGVLDEGRILFREYPGILHRLDNLQLVAEGLSGRFESTEIYYDLSELRGYNYHTGIVFAVYLRARQGNGGQHSVGRRVAKGGRYDDIGEVFGRARGATGFDIDLKSLAGLIHIADDGRQKICIPSSDDNESRDDARWQKICELRANGHIVIEGEVADCDRRLVNRQGKWVLEDV